jgi:hypothetical protein
MHLLAPKQIQRRLLVPRAQWEHGVMVSYLVWVQMVPSSILGVPQVYFNLYYKLK